MFYSLIATLKQKLIYAELGPLPWTEYQDLVFIFCSVLRVVDHIEIRLLQIVQVS